MYLFGQSEQTHPAPAVWTSVTPTDGKSNFYNLKSKTTTDATYLQSRTSSPPSPRLVWHPPGSQRQQWGASRGRSVPFPFSLSFLGQQIPLFRRVSLYLTQMQRVCFKVEMRYNLWWIQNKYSAPRERNCSKTRESSQEQRSGLSAGTDSSLLLQRPGVRKT